MELLEKIADIKFLILFFNLYILYKMSQIGIHNNNCFNILPLIEDKSVDLIFCDLPYGQTNCLWDTEIDLVKMWEHFKRIRKIDTPIIFTTTTKFGHKLINSNPKEFKMDLIWVKSFKLGFLHAKRRPLVQHEMIYFFYKKAPKYNYLKYHTFTEYTTKKRPSKDSVYGDLPYYKQDIPQKKYSPPLPTSILNIRSKKSSSHSTAKPLELMKYILKYWSNEEDIVLDICMGGGVMGKACLDLNRKFIGIELNPEIFEMAKNTINKD